MKRNINIDLLRTYSIILIIIYHIYAVFNIRINIYLDAFISICGEAGVTAFFVLSGISIYFSLNKDHSSFLHYLKKRVLRILPQYYINIIVVLFFTSGCSYLALKHIPNLITHLFLIHNLFYSYHGSINGVLWTIGVIWWFYFLAFLIYKKFEEHPKMITFLSIIITIVSKIIIFNIIDHYNFSDMYYFIYGRQLITALDNFIIGMFIGKLIKEDKTVKYNYLKFSLSTLFFIVWVLLGSITVNHLLNINMFLHHNNIFSYFYHTVLAIIIAYLFYYFSKIKVNPDHIWNKMALFMAKHQYGLYLWHLIILYTLVNAPIIMGINKHYPILLYPVLLLIVVPICLLMDIIIDSYDYSKLFKKK